MPTAHSVEAVVRDYLENERKIKLPCRMREMRMHSFFRCRESG